MRKLAFLFGLLILMANCKKTTTPADIPKTNLFVSGDIKSSVGGSLENGTGIKITFPANGLPEDVTVRIGIRGDEPKTVQNSKLTVIGTPFTLVIPVDTLKKTALIEFPKPADFSSADEITYLAFNGKTYMPLYYEVNGNKIEVQLDVLNYIKKYTSTLSGGFNLLGEIIIIGVVYKQTPPTNQMGLKEVNVESNGKLSYSEVGTITQNEKCVIFIHGWFSSPDTWEKFIPLFKTKQNVGYTKILTFGYNSSLPINENGMALANVLASKFQNKKVDLVVHSMGGLVSRSAIENFNSTQYIRNLVTMGTPHRGSPLAALRNLIGILVANDGIPEYIAYNMKTQGIRDMFPTSDFIVKLNLNPPSTVPYYAIAAENDACGSYQKFLGTIQNYCWPISSEDILAGNDDGVVAKSSALGIQKNNNIGLPTELFLLTFLAHTEIVQSESFVNLVAAYLNQQSQSVSTNGLMAYYPFSGNANDASGNGNNGVINGATLTTDRKGNTASAFSFNGISDYIQVPNNPTLNITDEISVSVWINPSNAGDQRIIDKATVGQSDAYMVDIRPTQELRFIVGNPSPSNPPLTGQVITQNNKWYHIVTTYDKSNVRFYIDGVLNSTFPQTGQSTVNSNPLRIGANSLLNGNWFNGKIDDVRIYNRALPADEIQTLFKE